MTSLRWSLAVGERLGMLKSGPAFWLKNVFAVAIRDMFGRFNARRGLSPGGHGMIGRRPNPEVLRVERCAVFFEEG
jgi:hypothetical protein